MKVGSETKALHLNELQETQHINGLRPVLSPNTIGKTAEKKENHPHACKITKHII